MIAPALARANLARPTIRITALGAGLAGGWYAWSPGTAFGLSGLLGGWEFAGRHLLDAGLVLLALAGALTGAGVRERRVDEQLHGAGIDRWGGLQATVAAAALVALAVAAAFAAGTAAGGLVRAVTGGGSPWIDAAYAPTVADAMTSLVRLGLASALVGGVAALVGWIARREDLGAAVVVALALPYLEQSAALFGRLPPVAEALAFGPWGALRAVALADRGLAAPGHEQPTATLPFALVLLGWLGLLLVAARPPGRGRTVRVAATPPVPVAAAVGRSIRRPAIGVLAVAAVVTVVVGATVPTRLSEALPWRWQRSWRQSVHDGWSSSQTVDLVVADLRRGVDPGSRLTRPDAVSPAVADSLRRASRVELQPESTMRGPEQVVVRLRFDEPVRSGAVAFTDYLVRFTCEVDGLGQWRIARTEGPVASATAEGTAS